MTNRLQRTNNPFPADFDADAPWVGVHVLSEFVYCHRAGFVTHEMQESDTGSEELPIPRLADLPSHEIDEIRSEMTARLQPLKVLGLCFVVSSLFLVLLYTQVDSVVSFCMLPAVLLSGIPLRNRLIEYRELRLLERDYDRAVVKEPNWDQPLVQPVNWWSLLRAGFVSVRKADPLRDIEARVTGNAWRYLQRRVNELPVVRIRVNDDLPDPKRSGQLNPQQFARLAAYAHLIQTCERLTCEWAIVLFNNSHEGLAVPVTPDVVNLFHTGLQTARDQLRISKSNQHHRPEPRKQCCIRCPHGKPRRVEHANEFLGTPVLPLSTESTKDGELYHCPCGDRYRWVPPHERAVDLGLID